MTTWQYVSAPCPGCSGDDGGCGVCAGAGVIAERAFDTPPEPGVPGARCTDPDLGGVGRANRLTPSPHWRSRPLPDLAGLSTLAGF